MYTAFFNLKRKPFELVPDPEFLLLSRAHKRALLHLNYGMSENAGFILITGEVGTGKTTLIRRMMKGLNEDVKLARVNNTRVTSEQLIAMINEDFGLQISGRDKTGMLGDLSEFLIDQYAHGKRPVIVVDEAQNLSPNLLEEIRLLSNLETDKAKLVQIILVGQPELARILARPELRQLRQRISISCHIQPLSREETETYIFHRLEVAGNRQAVRFQDGVIDIIHNFSRGIPRLINIACDFLLLSAFGEGAKEISAEFVKDVTSELETTHGYWHDEEPKKGRDRSSEIDDLKEMLNRLDRIEVVHYKLLAIKAEGEGILTRLSEKERLLDNLLAEFKNEMLRLHTGDIDNRFNAIREELKTLQERTAGSEKTSETEAPGDSRKKRNLWERIFN